MARERIACNVVLFLAKITLVCRAMSALCSASCACKAVDRSKPLSDDIVAVLQVIRRFYVRDIPLTHVLSVPVTTKRLLSMTLLHRTVSTFGDARRDAGFMPWLLNQGVCLYSGLFPSSTPSMGWSVVAPSRCPDWSPCACSPLNFACARHRALLLQAGAWPPVWATCRLRKQWRRWHGRDGRRVAVKMLIDSFTA